MKTWLLTLLLASILFVGQTLTSRAADSTTANIFSGQTVFANSLYNASFKYSGAVDGIATAYNGSNPGVYTSEFVFADKASAAQPDLLSISGFTASAGIDSITFFGTREYGSNRAETSVIIYTSTTDFATSADALNTANYTALNGGIAFSLPTNASHSTFSEGVDSAGSTQDFDTLTGLDIPVGTESILFSFTRPGTSGPGFSEIQGFAAVPEPSTWLLLGLGGVALIGFSRRFQRTS